MSTPAAGASSSAEFSTIRWQFINESNDSQSNLTQVKRHVMQEYVRRKKDRWGQKGAREADLICASKRGRPKIDRIAKHEYTGKVKEIASINQYAQNSIRHIEKGLLENGDKHKPLNNYVASSPCVTAPVLGSVHFLPHHTPPYPVQETIDLFSYNQDYISGLYDTWPLPSSPDALINPLQPPKTTLSTAPAESPLGHWMRSDWLSRGAYHLYGLHSSISCPVPLHYTAYLLDASYCSGCCKEYHYFPKH